MQIILKVLAIVMFSGVFISCFNDPEIFDDVAQFQKDTTAIGNYVRANNNGKQYVKHPTGVYMVINTLGTGLPAINYSATVNVDYAGTVFPGGQAFDDGNIEAKLSSLIWGWRIALTQLPVGTNADVFIPSYYGYGQSGQGSIPPNTTLRFNLEFNSINFTSTEKAKFTSDTTDVKEFVNGNFPNAIKDPSGLYYIMDTEGTGATPDLFDRVKVKYVIKSLESQAVVKKDFGTLQPTATFYSTVVDYVHAAKIVLRKMKEGGKATIFVPSGLGYGTDKVYDPANPTQVVLESNSNFILEIELLEVL